jgi:hypothetical protein
MRVTTILGVGALPVHLWQLKARRIEVESPLKDGLEAFQLRFVQQQRLLEGEHQGGIE